MPDFYRVFTNEFSNAINKTDINSELADVIRLSDSELARFVFVLR